MDVAEIRLTSDMYPCVRLPGKQKANYQAKMQAPGIEKLCQSKTHRLHPSSRMAAWRFEGEELCDRISFGKYARHGVSYKLKAMPL